MLWDAVMDIAARGIQENGTFLYKDSWYTIRNGQLSGDRRYVGSLSDKIKQAYSKKSVYAAAKKQGWLVKEVGPNKLQVIRRY
jgi:hypothetical protein